MPKFLFKRNTAQHLKLRNPSAYSSLQMTQFFPAQMTALVNPSTFSQNLIKRLPAHMVVESLQPHELHEYHSLKPNTLKPTKTQFWVVK